MATDLLNVLHRQASHSFSRIMTEDESWFLNLYFLTKCLQPAEMKWFQGKKSQ
jgi:hypothetical protein